MSQNSSATLTRPAALPATPVAGLLWGLVGVAAFSFTMPFTRVAVGGLSPLFIGSGRAVVAALLAVGALALTRQRLPHGRQWVRLAVVGGGIVSMFLGFFAWYRGLAIGPMARVRQVQLVQPVMTIAWAGLLLDEDLTLTTIVGGLVVVALAGAAVRVRLDTRRD